ncbi:MAG TPA: FecR domain-containing protein [Puia sp.]|jgi:ferric-dicitrate binding protein FerR (iron transport regulator)|nr:FecR domain-containing protein [Puia sp.]
MLSPKKRRKLIRLIEKYQKGTATPEEAAFVEAYYKYFDLDNASQPSLLFPQRQEQEDRLFGNIQARIRQPPEAPPVVRMRKYTRVAAAVLLLAAGGALVRYMSKKRLPAATSPVVVRSDIAPGGNKAILTLGNGSTIVLDSASSGFLTQEGGATVAKTDDGQLVYQKATSYKLQTASEPDYNTLSTPKGGQYRIQLPDGTRVWLNSASSIHYPVAFTGDRREVDITGEAYFEVAQVSTRDGRRKMPFIVHTDRHTEVEVLGTHFNIMAYADEDVVRATLLEGKVKVANLHDRVLLSPGQQAVLETPLSSIKVSVADTDKETAWISGFFQFDHTDLPALMRQLQRWYDVEPVYPVKDNGRRFGGRISRSLSLREMLHLLESNDIHFIIEGKKLIVQQ